uniref:Putative salivary lipocalin n=1 Tax=Ixodes ricinus TaxID=34613 RepID=A0A0K8R7F8_IXORI
MKLAYWFISCYFLEGIVCSKPGEIRIDDAPDYLPHQDIKKALGNPIRKSWMYYRTYSSKTDGFEHECVYAEVAENQPEGNIYEFTQGYTNGKGNKTVKVTLYATPFITEDSSRSTENGMKVTAKKNQDRGKNYRLIFSDYRSCDILRVLGDSKTYGYDCELYLHEKNGKIEVPKKCESIYGLACGRGHRLYRQQVYHDYCKGTSEGPSDTSPMTPQQPEKPEEETTTVTPAPGC